MCKVSDKIKFCTCGSDAKNVRKLDNYWILYRYNNNDVKIIDEIWDGIVLIKILQNDELNKNTILNRLKELDAFDVSIKFEDSDMLEVHLNHLQPSKKLVYTFNYYDKEWHFNSNESISETKLYKRLKSGKIENAINK
jgi:hypothetical protein